MGITSKLKTLFRGDIPFYHLPQELVRRQRARAKARTERASLDDLNVLPARLLPEFSRLSSHDLTKHFREREHPQFWPAMPRCSTAETERAVRYADRIVNESTWDVMGFGPLKFEGDNRWRRDPLSGHGWGLEYHRDIPLVRGDGSDVRVLWEVNRFGHAITLALAFKATGEERYAETFFGHVESWIDQNPYARGANWGCAMEAALRAVNVLAAFDIFRRSAQCTQERLARILRLFDQHGRFIVDNIEFSYIATSNHYLSDVVGLFWIGTMMPELEHAAEWRQTGLSEMLREMDKQVLPDGVDFEASTGYHRFVTEMFITTLLMARANGIEIADPYWQKQRQMLEFLRTTTRPDGRMPMIGDCDGSRFVPTERSDADETSFLLDRAATLFNESEPSRSTAYPDAGIYILRDKDLYLAFNASDCGLNGRGSHGHNDALSIEVSAFDQPFIVDPGSYVYNLDRENRKTFRSTAYHSTVMVDGVEQNTINVGTPFIIGNEAKPRVIEWSSTADRDVVSAVHLGYRRLPEPITHRRTVIFDKRERYWMVVDELDGRGEHDLQISFHLAPAVKVSASGIGLGLSIGEVRLLITPGLIASSPQIREALFSRNYGHTQPSQIVTWQLRAAAPFKTRFLLIPIGPTDDETARLELATRLADNK